MSDDYKNFKTMMEHKKEAMYLISIDDIDEKIFDKVLECVSCRPDDGIDRCVNIFIRHEINHKSFKMIGDELGISADRVRQVYMRYIRHIRIIYKLLLMAEKNSGSPIRETLVFAAYRYLKERTVTDLFRYLGKNECDYRIMSIQEAMLVIEESLKTRDAVFLHNSLEAFKEAGYTPRYKNLSTATK